MVDTTTGNGARWQPPVPCRPAPVDLGMPAVAPPAQRRTAELEAAALLRAFGAGNGSLAAASAELHAACDVVVDRFQQARAGIDDVDRYAAGGRLAQARAAVREVAARHAQDGPENLRRRVMWRWLVWLTIALAAVFDASFVATVLQRIFGVGPGSWLYYFSYLPGIGMALCLLAAGTALAEHLFRHRVRATRAETRGPLNPWLLLRRIFWDWRPVPQTRRPDDLPWPRLAAPIVFTVTILGLLGAGAYLRAAVAGRDFAALASFQPVFVVLLLLLSIAAIAVKVLSHNPYADRADEADGQLKRADRDSRLVVATARQGVAEHAKAWLRLQSTLASIERAACQVVEDACARILDERGERGGDGAFPLPLARLRWPLESGEDPGDGAGPAGNGAASAGTSGNGAGPDGAAPPRLQVEILDYARDVSRRYHPDPLETALSRAVANLHELPAAGPEPSGGLRELPATPRELPAAPGDPATEPQQPPGTDR